MALEPSVRFPGQVATGDAGYPHGRARNRSMPGDSDGTPWVADFVNDIWGLLQSLLAQAGIAPSGDPDEVGASQYLQALRVLRTMSHIANWFSGVHDSGAGAAAADRTKIAWSRVLSRFLAGADAAPFVRTATSALDWSTPGTPPDAAVYTFAEDDERVVAGMAGGNCWYTDDGDEWIECTGPGGAITIYDATLETFMSIAFDGDVSTSPTGATFTDVGDVGAMSSQSVVNARAAASNGTRWVVVGLGDTGVGDAALIKTSDNAGEDWEERSSPTEPSASNGLLSVIWCERLGLFVACGANGRILTSPNGADWTAQTTGVTASLLHAMEVDELLVVAGASTLLVSSDGVTWRQLRVPTGMTLIPQSVSGITDSPIGLVGHAVNALLR